MERDSLSKAFAHAPVGRAADVDRDVHVEIQLLPT